MKKKTILTFLILVSGGVLAYLQIQAKKYIKVLNDGTSWGDVDEY